MRLQLDRKPIETGHRIVGIDVSKLINLCGWCLGVGTCDAADEQDQKAG
jgi:hypothetical protein